MSPLAPYRKLVGSVIGGVITGLTWIIAVNANPSDWKTWAQFALFLLPAVATYFSPPNDTPTAPVALAGPSPVDATLLAEQLAAVHDQLHGDVPAEGDAPPPAEGEAP